jgi:hypothetical protein
MKFKRNQPRSLPIVRVARLAGPALVSFASFQAHRCLRHLSHLTPTAVMPKRAAPAARRMSDKFPRGMRAQKADQRRHHY